MISNDIVVTLIRENFDDKEFDITLDNSEFRGVTVKFGFSLLSFHIEKFLAIASATKRVAVIHNDMYDNEKAVIKLYPRCDS